MSRAPVFAYTPEQHERIQLGLHAERPESEPSVLRVAITANLVATNAKPLTLIAHDAIAEGRTRIMLDLTHCAYIDARGFGQLVAIANQANRANRAGGSVTIANAHEDLRTLFVSQAKEATAAVLLNRPVMVDLGSESQTQGRFIATVAFTRDNGLTWTDLGDYLTALHLLKSDV